MSLCVCGHAEEKHWGILPGAHCRHHECVDSRPNVGCREFRPASLAEQGAAVKEDMRGTRLPDESDYVEGLGMLGAYWRRDGIWFAVSPNWLIANLSKHSVIEHADGTISVSPSILVSGHGQGGKLSWHGYLERGVWREC